MKRGILLVANQQSQDICANLIYSIRNSGCQLPIRIIHFGGRPISSPYILSQAEYLLFENFPEEAREFILKLRRTITSCPQAFLYRFLGWFMDWDEFIYSDNDIVALCNWEELFGYLDGYQLVHADEEYTTKGRFNYKEPEAVDVFFGNGALETAFTAGHLVVKADKQMLGDIDRALIWFAEHQNIPLKHDQSLLHIASLLGNWRMLNLCKDRGWLSSWAGDYRNTLEIIQKVQQGGGKISHLHYSGGTPDGSLPIQDLLFSADDTKARLEKIFLVALKGLSGYAAV